MRLLLAAGEVSADRIGAGVARAVRARVPAAEIVGLGGTAMADEGVALLADTNALGAVGVSEALRVAPALGRAFLRVRREVRTAPPEAALLIGNDAFHLGLARWLRARGIPTGVLFPPQIWLWRRLAPLVAGSYDAIFASFPEEADAYATAGATVRFVGHYLADEIHLPSADDRARMREDLGLDEDRPVIAVLPGSRRAELHHLLPRMRDALAIVRQRRGPIQVVLPVSDARFRPFVDRALISARNDTVRVLAGRGRDALIAADVAMCASGTATLEAALLGTPMVVAYRVSRTTYAAIQAAFRARVVRPNHIALPNLVLQDAAVPELKQHDCTPEALAGHVLALLDDATTQCRRLAQVRVALRAERALATVAAEVIEMAGRSRRASSRSGIAS
jgi:lipid-A-disaccharide synthase